MIIRLNGQFQFKKNNFIVSVCFRSPLQEKEVNIFTEMLWIRLQEEAEGHNNMTGALYFCSSVKKW